METLYLVLYLLAFIFFVGAAGAAAAAYRRPERPPLTWILIPLGLAAWSLVLVIVSARALGN